MSLNGIHIRVHSFEQWIERHVTNVFVRREQEPTQNVDGEHA